VRSTLSTGRCAGSYFPVSAGCTEETRTPAAAAPFPQRSSPAQLRPPSTTLEGAIATNATDEPPAWHALIASDRQLLYRAIRDAHCLDLNYEHRRAATEQLLALPDAIAWCWANGGDWRRSIDPVVL